MTTAITAIALKPSISGRYFKADFSVLARDGDVFMAEEGTEGKTGILLSEHFHLNYFIL